MNTNKKFHLHGDNIIECERVILLIIDALSEYDFTLTTQESLICPKYEFILQSNSELPKTLQFTFFPGFGRWNNDLIDSINISSGGLLREAPDAILCEVNNDNEQPILAIEFCGALPAGNQAWQRNGRAYSLGLSGIPYIYIAELGGYELDSNRRRKSPRMPNPAVPFSYISFSSYQNTFVLPAYIESPGADESSREIYSGEFCDQEIKQIIRSLILNLPIASPKQSLEAKTLSLVKKISENSRRGRSLSPSEWDQVYLAIKDNQTVVDYLLHNTRMNWSKTAYINALTNTAKRLLAFASNYGIGLTSTNLPMCIIPSEERLAFTKRVTNLYNCLSDDFVSWLSHQKPLVISWIMGFKPRGDDARPDRGLPPFTRMLIGEEVDHLSVIYGPANEATWPLLIRNPHLLASQNGLWQSIFVSSDAILIDSMTDRVTEKGYLKEHWDHSQEIQKLLIPLTDPTPLSIGENDVDTILHILFNNLLGMNFFEGLCNPPGGDWSGISVLSAEKEYEYRWLSLPRVSGINTKRPDHVFQIFGLYDVPVILSVESKENPKNVKNNIGSDLIEYLRNLFCSSPDVVRIHLSEGVGRNSFRVNDADSLFCYDNDNKVLYASAVAFLYGNDVATNLLSQRSNADLLMAFEFLDNAADCIIHVYLLTEIGKEIAGFIANSIPKNLEDQLRFVIY